jgi:NTE family protein
MVLSTLPSLNNEMKGRIITGRDMLHRLQMILVISSLLLSGCVTTRYPINAKLNHYDPVYGYRFTNINQDSSGNTLLIATFSGGGTRAAALAYGALEELAKTEIRQGEQKQRLLDQLKVISSISGGSYTAAYYGLFGDRIFQDFEARFLKRDTQSEISRIIFAPLNLVRLTSPYFGRADLVAEHLDEELFEHRTFADLLAEAKAAQRPYIVINATDMSLGSRFEFSQEQFDLLCSDLNSFSVARAVAASSAIPLFFSPLTLKNYAGQCNYQEPPWIEAAHKNRDTDPRRYVKAAEIRSYQNASLRPYLHLLDGGVSDNTGLRGPLDAALTAGSAPQLAQTRSLDAYDKVVYLIVNAQVRGDFSLDQRESVPGISEALWASSRIIDRYSLENILLLRESFKDWEVEINASRKKNGNAAEVKFYLIEVSFDFLENNTEREFFNLIPTAFRLPGETVDKLREVAGRLIRQSPDFQMLMRDLAEGK